MSLCKTGCGREQEDGRWLCVECAESWLTAPEAKRNAPGDMDAGARRDLVDFCTRARAERQNGGQP